MAPGNREFMDLMTYCGSQWAHGMGGPVCLRVEAILAVADRLGMAVDDTFFAKLRAYEAAALAAMHTGTGKG